MPPPKTMRAEVKELSRQVGQAKKAGDEARAAELSERSRQLGEEERAAAAEAESLLGERRTGLLYLPNIPADDAPDGMGEDDNVEVRRWWPGQDAGRPEPTGAEHQRGPALGDRRGAADPRHGTRRPAGRLHVPPVQRAGARLLRALTAFAIDRHAPDYEEIRPPTVVLTETMTSTGHLPKFADDAYHLERDDLWLIPTAEVPLTSMHRGEILEESQLPLRFTAATACYRREAGFGRPGHPGAAAGARVRQGGALRLHDARRGALEAQADILRRAESMLQELELPYRVLDLCAETSAARRPAPSTSRPTRPGVDRWLEVSSVSWFRDYQARRANVRFRPAGGGPLQLVHTVNGSALAWPRIWAALVENGRQADGTVLLPESPGAVHGRRTADQGAMTVADVDGSGPGERFGFGDGSRSSRRESRRLADVVATLDLEARVPSTPGVGGARPGPPHRRGAVVLGRERAGPEPRRALRGLADRACPRTPTCWPGWAGAPTPCSGRCARSGPTRPAGPGGPSRTRRAPSGGTRPRRRPSTAGTPRAWSGSSPPLRPGLADDGVPEFIEIMVGEDSRPCPVPSR